MKVDWLYRLTLGKTEYDSLTSLIGGLKYDEMTWLTEKEKEDIHKIYSQLSEAEMIDKKNIDY